MTLKIDPDVQRAAEFMQANFAAVKLVPIAEALSALAPILWGQHGREAITPLTLSAEAISAARTQADATQ